MNQAATVIRTIIFTIFIPGIVVTLIPWFLTTVSDEQVKLGLYRYLGIPVLLVGAFFYFSSVLSFLNVGKGSPMIFFMKKVAFIFGEEPEKLVSSGLYRFSRNPMYLGVFLFVLGEGILLQFPAVIIWGVLTFPIFHVVVVFLEEPHLRKKYGEEYEKLLESTPRWLGIPCKKRK